MSNEHRRPGAWPRTLSVRGVVFHTTDGEVAVIKQALEQYARNAPSPGRGTMARSLLHFWSTGRPPSEPRELADWRARASEEQGASTDDDRPRPVDASDPSLWPVR